MVVEILDHAVRRGAATGQCSSHLHTRRCGVASGSGHVDVVFSDGEHVGIPLALAMRTLRIQTPHLMIGHHLSTRSKSAVFHWLRPHRRISRILVHSPNQCEVLGNDIPMLSPLLRVVPYGIDTEFWSPQGPTEEDEGLVVSAGREHRDYNTLLRACPEAARLFIADHSFHSPEARTLQPDAWPTNVERRPLGRQELRAKLFTGGCRCGAGHQHAIPVWHNYAARGDVNGKARSRVRH